ncbi:MAG: hypothetical protein K2O24_02120 [Muribaculaceae bacterium]|nr:hypothetical protein [Muribaculaceae bacterium]
MRYLLAIIGALALSCSARAEFIYEYTRFLEDGKEWWYQGEYADSEGDVKPFVCGFVLEKIPSAEEGVTAMYCNVVNERYENVFGRPIAVLYEDVAARRVSVDPMIKEVFEDYGKVDMNDAPQVRFVAVYCNFGYQAEGIPPVERYNTGNVSATLPDALYDFNIPVKYKGPDNEMFEINCWTFVETDTMILKVFTYLSETFPENYPSFIEGIGCRFNELGVFLYPDHDTPALRETKSYNLINLSLMAVRTKEGPGLFCSENAVCKPWEDRSGIDRVPSEAPDGGMYDFSGRVLGAPASGQPYILKGRKYIRR